MEIVIASHNLHKIREFREMLKLLTNVELLSLLNFPQYSLPPETGNSFKDNAIVKAEHAAKALQKWVLADDSGLVVPALKSEPGIFSRRYASEDATDGENRQKLLSRMQSLKGLERTAYFECWIALADPHSLKKCVNATCEGLIIDSEKGRNGFGYDAVFVKHDYDKTFAELDEKTKNRVSHRRKALEKLLPTLELLT